jgi:hypothetical protein
MRALGNVTRTTSRLCKHYNRREICPYGNCQAEQRQREAQRQYIADQELM